MRWSEVETARKMNQLHHKNFLVFTCNGTASQQS